jgi:hypothetical protein
LFWCSDCPFSPRYIIFDGVLRGLSNIVAWPSKVLGGKMRRKTRSHKNRETQNTTNMLGGVDIQNTAKQTAQTVASTVGNNKLLIGGIAAGCGVAIFLLATDAGKRARREISDRTSDLYDFMSEQVTNGWEQVTDGWDRLRGLIENAISEQEEEEDTADAPVNIRRTA